MTSISLGPLAVQVSHLVWLLALLVAAGVGHLAGRSQRIGIGKTLTDMVWAALLAARLAFVAQWFDLYHASPWTMLDIRDGGFNVWAGLAAAALVAALQLSTQPASRRPLLAGLTAGALMWFGATAALDAMGNQQKQTLPTVALQTLGGEAVTLAGLAQGKPLVVNLWATWCPPCRREMPVLAEAQQRETSVTLVFADQGESATAVQRYLAASQLNLQNAVLDPASALGRVVGSQSLPTTLFYSADGRLVDTHVGALSAATLAAKLAKLRGERP